MARFNFNNITLSDSADVSKIAENFNKIEDNAVLKTDKAATNKDGLMSKEDKTKLNGVEQQANKTIVDSALSSTSTNPVQNKVVKSALDGKVEKVVGKGLSTNDYTNEEKEKVANLAEVASSGNYDDLLNTPIYNGGWLDINDGSSSTGELAVNRTYILTGLRLNNSSLSVFNNSLVRIFESENSTTIVLLASANMHQSGYIDYRIIYNNGTWSLSTSQTTSGIVTGNFTMTTTEQIINLGFTPRCVIINSGATRMGNTNNSETEIVTTAKPTYIYSVGGTGGADYTTLEIVNNGFKIKAASSMNDGSSYGTGYRYIAFK